MTFLEYRRVESRAIYQDLEILSKRNMRGSGHGFDEDNRAPFYRNVALPRRPRHDEIATRAYELFLKRGSIPGHETEDWLQAERELIEQSNPNDR